MNQYFNIGKEPEFIELLDIEYLKSIKDLYLYKKYNENKYLCIIINPLISGKLIEILEQYFIIININYIQNACYIDLIRRI